MTPIRVKMIPIRCAMKKAMTNMMGAKTVLVGLQPAVAITLVELGVELKGVHTALNMDKGLQWLQQNIP